MSLNPPVVHPLDLVRATTKTRRRYGKTVLVDGGSIDQVTYNAGGSVQAGLCALAREAAIDDADDCQQGCGSALAHSV